MSIVNIEALKNLGCQLYWSGSSCSSNSPKSITSNGSVTQVLPYPGAGIGMFDGDGDYLTLPNLSDFDFSSNPFTVECWVCPRNLDSTYQRIFSGANSSGISGVELRTSDTGKFELRLTNTVPSGVSLTGTTTAVNNTWYHLAGVRTGNTFKLFVNGVQEGGDLSFAYTLFNSSENYRIARHGVYATQLGFYGNVSEFRISNIARYTANFTPPRTQLQNDANTKLLLHFLGSGQNFVDSSPSPKTITVPNAGTTNQATQLSSPCGSGVAYFDGNGDYLDTGTNPVFGTGNFTIETFIKTTSTKFVIYEDDYKNPGSYNAISIYYTGGILFTAYTPTGSNGVVIHSYTTSVINNGSWHHIAFVRFGTGTDQCILCLDGAVVATATNAINLNSTAKPYIGYFRNFTGYDFIGWCSEYRISNIARYTSDFSSNLPTQPFKPDVNTKLLLHFDGVGQAFYDSSDPPGDNGFPILPDGVTVTTAGNFAVQKLKTGLNCYRFDGSTNYISLSDHDAWTIWAGDATLVGWFKSDNTTGKNFVCQSNQSTTHWFLSYSSGSTWIELRVTSSGTVVAQYTCPLTMAANTWYHFAIVRSGNSCLMYINCVPQTVTVSTAFGTIPNIGGGLYFTTNAAITTYYQEYIKDLMIFKGKALSVDQIGAIMEETYIY